MQLWGGGERWADAACRMPGTRASPPTDSCPPALNTHPHARSWNTAMALPLRQFPDAFAVTARCAHHKFSYYGIDRVGD